MLNILLNGTPCWLLLVLVVMIGTSSSVAADNTTATNDAKPGCRTQCGNLTISYPFGIGPSCSYSPSFSLVCDESSNPPKAFTEKLNSSSTRFQVLRLNISETQISVSAIIAYNCPPSNGSRGNIISLKTIKILPPLDSPFTLSNKANKFSIAGSCDYKPSVSFPGSQSDDLTCWNSCFNKTINDEFSAGPCAFGNGCCEKPATKSLHNGFSLKIEYSKKMKKKVHTECSYIIFGVDDGFVLHNVSDYSDPAFVRRIRDDAPMMVDWVIGNQTCDEARKNPSSYACHQNSDCTEVATEGYRCTCSHGYQGNPYLSPGCTDKNECEEGSNRCINKDACINIPGDYNCSCPKGYLGDGLKDGKGCVSHSTFPFKQFLGLSLGLLSSLIIGSGVYILIQHRRLAKTKEKFFNENGGLMLKEKLESSSRGRHCNTFKLFTIKELRRATKSFSKDLVVGIGGYGTVYKGTLRDNTSVAVKISKLVDSTQIEQFINEMVILTQIHHRNVVKLMGCCLEAEIPILVYEFVTNGSLHEHIHGRSYWLNWDNRLRIATETATALGYLHSAASTPIIHRDVKSANILLDENYVAKVSDFGASRLIPMDKTQMSTLVQGTLGYMDPDYLLTSQLTDKSDVYSFGVVLAELLTGEEPLSRERRMKDRNLAKYFVTSFKEGRLLDIIDPRIVDEAPQAQLTSVAEIVEECLSIKGVDRPMMKDVAVQLAALQKQAIKMSDDSRKDGRSNSMADFSFTIEAR